MDEKDNPFEGLLGEGNGVDMSSVENSQVLKIYKSQIDLDNGFSSSVVHHHVDSDGPFLHFKAIRGLDECDIPGHVNHIVPDEVILKTFCSEKVVQVDYEVVDTTTIHPADDDDTDYLSGLGN